MESMMYVGKTPWHGLGTPIPEEKKISVREAIIAAKLDWQVELRRVVTVNPEGIAKAGILDHFAVCRTSDNAFLGENEGLIVAEVELTSTDQSFNCPQWLGREVTDDPRYYNSNLCIHPFRKWN